jgi:hypothetical protein
VTVAAPLQHPRREKRQPAQGERFIALGRLVKAGRTITVTQAVARAACA